MLRRMARAYLRLRHGPLLTPPLPPGWHGRRPAFLRRARCHAAAVLWEAESRLCAWAARPAPELSPPPAAAPDPEPVLLPFPGPKPVRLYDPAADDEPYPGFAPDSPPVPHAADRGRVRRAMRAALADLEARGWCVLPVGATLGAADLPGDGAGI